MHESLYLVYTRNCRQEALYYIQETKTIFQKVIYTHTKRKQKFTMVLVISTGKRQISYVSRANNK